MLIDIKTCNPIREKKADYSYGGIYLITTENNTPLYVGKAKNIMKRLKGHYYSAINNKGLEIDRHMFLELPNVRFYIIDKYTNIGINFFSKNLDNVVENYYIGRYKTNFPNGLNMVHYDKLRLK